MDIKSLLAVLWRKKWILIIVPIIAMAAAFLFRMFGEWRFKSSAQLATGLTVADELSNNAKYLNPYEVQVTFNNLIEIINSRTVLGLVSYRLAAHDLGDSTAAFRRIRPQEDARVKIDFQRLTPIFNQIIEEKIKTLSLLDPNVPNEKLLQIFIQRQGYDYESLTKDLTVSRVNQSDFIDLTFSSENPELSAFVVNAVSGEFIRYYSAAKANRSSTSLKSLEEIARQRKEYYDKKAEDLQNFRASNQVVNSRVESEVKVREIRDYEKQIADERKKIRALEVTLASLNLRIQDAEAGSPAANSNERIISLRKSVNSLTERYIQSGRKENALKDSLDFAREKLDQEILRANSKAKITPAQIAELKDRREEANVEYDIAKDNLVSLQNIYNSMRYRIGEFANNESAGNALEKEVEVANQEYHTALNRLNEAREKASTSETSIKQVLIAEPAEKAESKKTTIFAIFSGALSFAICVFSIVGIELLDSRIKTPERLKQQTRLRIAGLVPQLSSENVKDDLFFDNSKRHIQKEINEEVRKIRFEIEKHKVKVLLITSLKNTEGKTFFTMALANSLSLQRKRVLIIDTNLRNNSLTTILMAHANLKLLVDNFSKNGKLLGTGHSGRNEDDESKPGNLITRTKNSFIDIIGNKESQMSPSEIIPGSDFQVLLEWLKVQYDFILLEGPALNSFSDSRELSEFAELIIPVFSASSTLGAADAESLNFLKSLQQKLGPAILNKVEG